VYRIGFAITLGVAVMIGGCGDPSDESSGAVGGGWSTPGCELVRRPQHVTVGGVSMPTTPPSLATAIDRIDRGGRADFPQSFAGLEVDEQAVRAVVYRVPSPEFDDFVRRSAGTACIVVRDAAHSAADLAVWHDRVLDDLQYWSHHGVRIATVGARHDGAGVEIGVTHVAQAREELGARYGVAAPLLFVEQAPIQPMTPPTTPRKAPPSP
jgi:hypothetical protein